MYFNLDKITEIFYLTDEFLYRISKIIFRTFTWKFDKEKTNNVPK